MVVGAFLFGLMAFLVYYGHTQVKSREARNLAFPFFQLKANSDRPMVKTRIYYDQIGMQNTKDAYASAITVSTWNKTREYLRVTSIRLVNLSDKQEKEIKTDGISPPNPAIPCEEDVTLPLLEMLSKSSYPHYIDIIHAFGSYRITVTVEYQRDGKQYQLGPNEYDVEVKSSGNLLFCIKVVPGRSQEAFP